MLRKGDFSMVKVWVGLEARKFITASVEEVSLEDIACHYPSVLTAIIGREMC